MSTRGRITNIEEIKEYVTAGRATFTLENVGNSTHVTYQVKQPTEQHPHFVKFLSGGDNESDYSYLGTIFNRSNFKLTAKSPSPETKSAKGFIWLWQHITYQKNLPDTMHFYHEGRCGRCGRKLTTPESLRSGIGPICAGKE